VGRGFQRHKSFWKPEPNARALGEPCGQPNPKQQFPGKPGEVCPDTIKNRSAAARKPIKNNE
jgi:hypothetical protein